MTTFAEKNELLLKKLNVEGSCKPMFVSMQLILKTWKEIEGRRKRPKKVPVKKKKPAPKKKSAPEQSARQPARNDARRPKFPTMSKAGKKFLGKKFVGNNKLPSTQTFVKQKYVPRTYQMAIARNAHAFYHKKAGNS